jgi:hypothetical protein
MANQTQTAVPKLKLKPVWREGALALLSKPEPKPVLYDGHTIEEWAADDTWSDGWPSTNELNCLKDMLKKLSNT